MVAWNAFVGFLAVVLSMLTTAYSGNLGFAIIAVATGVLTAAASLLGPHLPQQSRIAVAVFPALATLLFAWRLASGVVLYWAASTAVSGLQSVLLNRKSA